MILSDLDTDDSGLDADIESFGAEPLRELMRKTRSVLRWHRDQRGDDRCWLDDWKLYRETLPENQISFFVLPERSEFMRRCERFFIMRQSPYDSETVPETVERPDADLEGMDDAALKTAIQTLRQGIRTHRDRGDWHRTWHDDEPLYQFLPERIPAITQLPRELLANCERFCDSRPYPCPLNKMHEW